MGGSWRGVGGDDGGGGAKMTCFGDFGGVGGEESGPLVFSDGRRAMFRCMGRASKVPSSGFCSALARARERMGWTRADRETVMSFTSCGRW